MKAASVNVIATMTATRIVAERLDLASMSPRLIEALLAGRRDEASSLGGFAIPADWPDEHDARFLRLRLDQMRNDPSTQEWLARAMVLRGARGADPRMVGHIGFHGPPIDGWVEIGYTVLAPYRRQGYAEESVRAMMRWAREEHHVRRFRLSIGPDNEPSLALARKLGFRKIGEQDDLEDGLEYVFDLVLG